MKSLPVKIPLPRSRGSERRILDIGSGNNCLDIATHLVDLLPHSDAERGGGLEQSSDKVFTEGTVERIPFPDGFFDFAHAAHVLEHVENPGTAIAELQRVARAGYIETPAAVIEQGRHDGSGLRGWSFHRWFVWSFPDQQTLYFKPKTAKSVEEFCDCRFGRAARKMMSLANFADLEPVIPYHCKMTQFVWKDRIRLEIWGEEQRGEQSGERCSCFYASFFAHMTVYFRSVRACIRRNRFRKSLPEVYQVVRRNIPYRF